MHLRVSGENIPDALLETVSAVTDHSILDPRQVQYNQSEGIVVLPIKRFPLLNSSRSSSAPPWVPQK